MVILGGVFFGSMVHARKVDSRICTSVRTETSPQIDGKLDEPAWSHAERVGGFVQLFPNPGKKAAFDTHVRVLHDDEAIYIGAVCIDPEPDKIVARVTRRDRWIESDWFQVDIDSRNDNRTGFFFAVNAAGVELDGVLFEENQESLDWDGHWSAKTMKTPEGWQVEMRIPLELLRFQAGKQVRFGINFSRRISRLNQQTQWQYVPPESGLRVSGFGGLHGLDLEDSQHWMFSPYILGRWNADTHGGTAAPTTPFELGADARWGIGRNFYLTMTANPDFGQVEVDEVVLNLSTIETFYAEKRPFFLEDRSLFQTPALFGHGEQKAQLFYTRRIGRPSRDPQIDDGEELVRSAGLPRIYGAAKLAGRSEGRMSVGLLQAVTSQQNARVRTLQGGTMDRLSEPSASYSVLSLRQDFWSRSSVGMMAAAMATQDEGTSITAQSDLQMELAGGDYRLDALSFFSYLTDERYLWQDEFVRAGLEKYGPMGYGGGLQLAKIGGEHLVGELKGYYYHPNLALNDVGYLDRADRTNLSLDLEYRELKPVGPIAKYYIEFETWIDRSAGGINLGDGVMLEGLAVMKNGWEGGVWLFSGWPVCDDRETRSAGKVVLCGRDHRWKSTLWVGSDKRAMVAAFANLGVETTENGYELMLFSDIVINPHPRLQLGLVPGYVREVGEVRWIDTRTNGSADEYLFADRHVESWKLTFRSTYTFTTALTLQTYAQVMLASVDYGRKYLQSVSGKATIHVRDLEQNHEIADEYDFTSTNLNLSCVLRWEYHPGSLAYLVYTGNFGNELEVAEFRMQNMMQVLFRGPAQHVLLFKLSFMWS